MSLEHDIPAELAPEPDDALPLLAAIRELQEIVGESASLNIGVHQLPVAIFAHESVTGMAAHTSEGSTWLSGEIKIGGHRFSIYSVHFPSATTADPDEVPL